jgi:hypothetical protein
VPEYLGEGAGQAWGLAGGEYEGEKKRKGFVVTTFQLKSHATYWWESVPGNVFW